MFLQNKICNSKGFLKNEITETMMFLLTSALASVPLVSLLISLWLVLSKLAVSLTFLLSEKFWFLGTQTKDKNHTALVNQIFT
jgi:hypothetical protein